MNDFDWNKEHKEENGEVPAAAGGEEKTAPEQPPVETPPEIPAPGTPIPDITVPEEPVPEVTPPETPAPEIAPPAVPEITGPEIPAPEPPVTEPGAPEPPAAPEAPGPHGAFGGRRPDPEETQEIPKTETTDPHANPYRQQYDQWQSGQYGQPPYQQQPPYGMPPYGQPPQSPYAGYQAKQTYAPYGQPQKPQYQPYQGQPPYQQQPPYGMPPYQPAPYGQPAYGSRPPEKPRHSGGLRAFLWILGVLGAIFVIGFCAYGVYAALSPDRLPGYSDSRREDTPSQESPDTGSESQPDADVRKAPEGSVLNPDSSGLVIEGKPAGDEMSASEVYKKVSPSIVGVVATSEAGQSSGSGIIASADGYIITNSHVVNDSKTNKELQVILHDGTKYNGTVAGFDKTTDLAVIKIDAKGLPVAAFGDSEELAVGDWVVAIGNPGGMTYASSLTRGVISGLNRTVGYSNASNMTYIQTDTAISPGASGGALVNMFGQVVGVNSSKLVATGYEGMGFSIPITKAKAVVDDLVSKGYVSGRARLGIGANQVSDAQAQMYGVPRGVVIVTIDGDSSFTGTEVQVNDIIIKADGSEIGTMEELYQALGLHKPGDTMTLTIYRVNTSTGQDRTFDVKVKLLADNGETQKTIEPPTGSSRDQ